MIARVVSARVVQKSELAGVPVFQMLVVIQHKKSDRNLIRRNVEQLVETNTHGAVLNPAYCR